ncbi:hypothetical protein DSUL_20565 [Desulfovibrionales bacterium]
MSLQRVRGIQTGEYVHKMEKLNFEFLILHGPIHNHTGPEVLVKNGGRLTVDAHEKTDVLEP